jgi:hypothetical protein
MPAPEVALIHTTVRIHIPVLPKPQRNKTKPSVTFTCETPHSSHPKRLGLYRIPLLPFRVFLLSYPLHLSLLRDATERLDRTL